MSSRDLNESQHRRVVELFEELAPLPEEERRLRLESVCDDPQVRDEVLEMLILEGDDLGDFMEEPLVSATVLEDLGDTLLVGGDGSEESVDVSVPGYALQRAIGEGGMGVVYAAEQIEPFRRRVALKVIRVGMDTREVVARFESERQSLALMEHEAIARVYDAGATSEGRPYFAMEFVDGVPITEYCDEHKLDVEERLRLFVRVSEGVQHAHQRGIIHRDLKPSNVLVCKTDAGVIPKIIDFGIAKSTESQLDDQMPHTQAGQIMGTPAYMSPEQAGLGVGDVDIRTDLYSLGVILYQLLVGRVPLRLESFGAGNLLEILRSIAEDETPRPSTRFGSGDKTDEISAQRATDPRGLLKQVRGDLDWIVMKLLEKDREKRYQSARDLAEDIRRHLRDEPVSAGPPSLGYRAGKYLKRHRVAVAVASGLVVALLAFAIGDSILERRDRVKTGQAFLDEAIGHVAEFESLNSNLEAKQRHWLELFGQGGHWRPFWEREEEIAAFGEYQEHQQLGNRYIEAIVDFDRAIGVLPESKLHLEARKKKERFLWNVRLAAAELGELALSPEDFEAMVRSQGLGTFDEELEGRGRVSFASIPEGADLYCFRYDKREMRDVPLAFDPTTETFGTPRLVVEGVGTEPPAPPFEAGDLFLAVGGHPVAVPGDVARALATVAVDEHVAVKVRRSGKDTPLDWAPYSSARGVATERLPPGRMRDTASQFGFNFAAAPLEFTPLSRIAREPARPDHVELELPRGSYLFVVRRKGFLESRYPMLVPRDQAPVHVRMVSKSEAPPGYLFVPSGRLHLGEDRRAYDGLERGSRNVDAFLMNRFEVRFHDYIEFLNAPETIARLDQEKLGEDRGFVLPSAVWKDEELARLSPQGPVDLVPRIYRGSLADWSEEKRHWIPQTLPPGLPLLGISLQAAVEYAAWLSEHRYDGRFRFRLPTEFEWERAARGADQRVFVWGDYPLWAYCQSKKGLVGTQLAAIGHTATDESVFGIRDLAGSLSEPTSTPNYKTFYVLRGGSWETFDDRDFRIGSRNRRYPSKQHSDIGLRLVAELRN